MLRQLRAFIVGESYWRVKLANGHELCELDTKTYLFNHREIRVRKVEWLEDLCGSGDLKNVKEVELHTPKGTAHIEVTEPYTAFQFSRGTYSMFTNERIKNLQVIGCVVAKDTGECEFAAWDQQTQQLYVNTIWDKETGTARVGLNNVKSFKAWREGVIDIGRLNIEALDLRGIA